MLRILFIIRLIDSCVYNRSSSKAIFVNDYDNYMLICAVMKIFAKCSVLTSRGRQRNALKRDAAAS